MFELNILLLNISENWKIKVSNMDTYIQHWERDVYGWLEANYKTNLQLL